MNLLLIPLMMAFCPVSPATSGEVNCCNVLSNTSIGSREGIHGKTHPEHADEHGEYREH